MHGQRYSVQNGNVVIHQQESAPLQTGAAIGQYSQEAVFTSLAAGTARFWVDNDGDILWRSGPIALDGADQLFRYTIFMMEGDDTTFSESDLEDEMSLPIISSAEEGEEDPETANTISAVESLAINIKSSYLRFNGEGYYGSRALYESGQGIDLLASTFNFEYKIRLKPSTAIAADHLVTVEPVEPIEIIFANPLVGFFALFMQQQLNDDTRSAIENQLNARIQDEIANRVGEMTSDEALINRTTASVKQISIHFDPLEEDFIEFHMILSIPSELVEESTSDGCSLNALALLLAGVFLLWQFAAFVS